MEETNPRDLYRGNHDKAFSKYDTTFQEKVLQTLLHDKDWAIEASELIDPEMFEIEHCRFLAGEFWKFFRQYKSFPSLGMFVSSVKELLPGLDQTLRSNVLAFLMRIEAPPLPADAAFVKDSVTLFCRRQNMVDAIKKSVEFVKEEKFDAVYTIMRHAVSASIPGDKGHNFFEDSEARFTGMDRMPVPTGMSFIDDIMGGGLSAGELGVVVAPTGVGKSHCLVTLGAEAIRCGFNVVHYTFELNQYVTGRRYDSNFTDIPSDDILLRKDEVKRFYSENSESYGTLFIKEYPGNYATVVTLKSHLEKLRLSGFAPDLIVIDYADCMRSTMKHDGVRFEQKAVYEELRALAQELKLPIWTAAQSNREGASSNIITSENMGEAYAKAQIADFIMGISRKAEEKAGGTGRIFVTKNRMGKDGFMFHVMVDTARSRFTQLDEEGLRSLQEAKETEDEERKKIRESAASDVWKAVNKKWKEIESL